MKIKSLIKKLLLVILLFAGLNSCTKVEDLFEDIKVILDWDFLKTIVNVQFVDARTNEMIGAEDYKTVTVTITGEGKEGVVDVSGIQKESYQSSNGFLTLGLNPNSQFTPGSSNPVRFNILASSSGFMPTSQSLTLTDEGTYNLTVFMANIEDPPDGVSIKITENTGQVIDGILQEELLVKTAGSEACIILPENLKLVDESGSKLEGSLDIRLTYYNNKEDGSLSTFPGGLVSRVQKYGDVLDGTLFPAGLVSIEIFDQYGKKARYFENQALQLIMTVSPQTYNPETQSEIKAGDEIPVQSYDPETGIWQYHQTINVSVGDRSDLEVRTYIPHLSWWSFDWFAGNFCDEGAKLIFKGDFGACNCITLDGIIRKKADDTFLKFISLNACEDSVITITNAPTGTPVYIDWLLTENCSDCFTDPGFNPLFIDDLCASNTYEIPLVCFKPNSTSVLLNISGYCPDKPDLIIRPAFGVWYRPLNDFCWRYAELTTGFAKICDVEINNTYVVGSYYDNVWQEWQIFIEENKEYQLELNLTNKVCEEAF